MEFNEFDFHYNYTEKCFFFNALIFRPNVCIIPKHNEVDKANDKVKNLCIINEYLLYLPKNLGETFQKLTRLSIVNSKVLEIIHLDFQNMTNLSLCKIIYKQH